ncbi:class I SAM-dependent methyltransferase [Sphingomicrobium lutaoense]|uniref:Putative methyltransferase n=1 Tax=Sphingomicrobium lutaoense TaxID=515949 RepID=A0A839Z0Z2_9SPHN|nr:methyltransferase domain-containing protein [Sphingomicrobium lutaoense]MBB3763342.1 putative methyltransferase [Sphingomicrobium lutaoense]
MRPIAYTIALLALGGAACAPAEQTNATVNTAASQKDALAAAIASPHRDPDNVARDQYRHPAETLEFFGVKPDDMVVEIWPGGGWYTEILAPYLAEEGSLALVASERGLSSVRKMMEKDPETYRSVILSPMDSPSSPTSFPAESADVVLTFRNVHNWEMGDKPYGAEFFASMFRMLRPGGTLGVVDHRLPENRPDEMMRTSGYMKQSRVIELAEAAGFELVDTSEINANSKDNANYEKGVWTLPPRLAEGDKDREKYQAIGESDRMTLKFRKPE